MAYCDYAAVVAVVNMGDSKEPDAMHLLKCWAFLKAKFQFSLFSSHIRGVDNALADALSRDNLQHFMCHHPQVQPRLTPLSPNQLDLIIIIRKPDWTSRLWTDLWRATFGQD